MPSPVVIAVASVASFGAGVLLGRLLPRRGAAGGGAAGREDAGKRVELYVGNLPYTVRTNDLRAAFEPFGKVTSTRIIKNKFNGKPKGFGFVEMADHAGAAAAIKKMNGSDLNGRKIVVNEAKSGSRDE